MNLRRLILPIILPVILLCALLALPVQPAAAQTPQPVVQAVMFFSPTCGHCQEVINEVLPPLLAQYGGSLEMLLIDMSMEHGPAYLLSGNEVTTLNFTEPDGQGMYLTVLQMFGLERGGVPFLVIGDTYLFGSADIPAQFPGLIETHLQAGGVGYPAIPGLAEIAASVEATRQAQPSATPVTPSPTAPTTIPQAGTSTPAALLPSPTPETFIPIADTPTLAQRLRRDPLGNGLAILFLLGMLASVGWAGRVLLRRAAPRRADAPAWWIPFLCLLGMGVAGYLAYVETMQVEAFCGPVGDCNTVQQSEYARLFGVLPIGMLGLTGYMLILAIWALRQMLTRRPADLADAALLVLTLGGTLFSIYLTFLEPFVIGATCAWCLTSALISTLLMLFSLAPGRLAFERLFKRKTRRRAR